MFLWSCSSFSIKNFMQACKFELFPALACFNTVTYPKNMSCPGKWFVRLKPGNLVFVCVCVRMHTDGWWHYVQNFTIAILIIYVMFICFRIHLIFTGFPYQICGLFMTWLVHLGGDAQSGKTSLYLNWATRLFIPCLTVKNLAGDLKFSAETLTGYFR